MIRVLADKNLYKLSQFLPSHIECILYDPRSGLPDHSGFDAWLLRTVTKVNPNTTPVFDKRLKFIGTGSSGSDHLDNDYIFSNEIHVADALGCNSKAVAEYIITALLLWADRNSKHLPHYSVGIVGVGNAGGEVAKILTDFDIPYVAFDPPRELRDPTFKSSTIKEVLDCDILTFHTPLNDVTYHWLNKAKIGNSTFELIINASRGGVVDESFVSSAHENGTIKDYIIDVWEGEPDFNATFMKKAFLATPHIAGYSEQSKTNATKMICEKLCAHFEIEFDSNTSNEPSASTDLLNSKSLTDILSNLHPLQEFDKQMRLIAHNVSKVDDFRSLRTDHPFRNEYRFIKATNTSYAVAKTLNKLGLVTA